MTAQSGHEHSEHNIVNAVETLTSIADLEIDSPIMIAEKHEIELQELPLIYRTVHWLHRKNAENVLSVVRDTYKTILQYLRHFYKEEYGKLIKHESVEGIKTIMVLVGEAAKKVDKYTRVFIGSNRESIKQSKEFRDLWVFYQRKIAPIAAQESLTKWIHQLPVSAVLDSTMGRHEIGFEKHVPTSEHLFVDLDTVKKDSEYELFLIRKEDGSRFFNPRLLRNIKLLCNFEEHFEQGEKADVLKEISLWKDIISRQIARNIVRQNWHLIDQFVKAAQRQYNNEMVSLLYRAVVALMLSSNQAVSIKEPVKGSSLYLVDFQRLIHTLLSSQDYQRIITYPPKNEEAIQHKIVGLAQNFCRQLYTGFHLTPDSTAVVNDLINRGEASKPNIEAVEMPELSLSSKLAYDYDVLSRALTSYNHVPMLHVIETLQDSEISGYDPLMLHNMPTSIFDLYPKGKRIAVLRMPTPTSQEYIHKAVCSEQFKAFLRELSHNASNKELLIFNLQDRTSMREYARCHALEELQKKDEFTKHLTVVSMTKDSDFYHQTGPYQDLNHADLFIEQLLEHVQSENAGYFYPHKIRKALFSGFVQKLCHAIHSIFFAKKNVLSRHNRLDFIELFYNFIQLKIIEVAAPSCIAYTCKDAIDISMPASCELFLLLKLINSRPLSQEEQEYLKVLLYVPAICYRGRNLFIERFSRMNCLVKLIEASIEEQGGPEFHQAVNQGMWPLFDHDMLSAVVTIPQPIL